jgi:hypothetical protein
VPARQIVKFASGVNKGLIRAVDGCFNGSPEMTLTETGIDDTLLSYMRCCVAPKDHLQKAGWKSDWTIETGPADLPLEVMSKLAGPVDFNTEAKVWLFALTSAGGLSCITELVYYDVSSVMFQRSCFHVIRLSVWQDSQQVHSMSDANNVLWTLQGLMQTVLW